MHNVNDGTDLTSCSVGLTGVDETVEPDLEGSAPIEARTSAKFSDARWDLENEF